MSSNPFNTELAEFMMPKTRKSDYKEAHDQVLKAIYSIAPASRITRQSHRVLKFPKSGKSQSLLGILRSIGGASGVGGILTAISGCAPLILVFVILLIPVVVLIYCRLYRPATILDILLKQVADDLKVSNIKELHPELKEKIETQQKYWKLGVEEVKDRYAKIQLSFEKGGKSNIIVGAVGYRSISDDKIEFGVSLYQEEWTEQDNVKLRRNAEVWKDEMVIKFATWRLHKSILL